MDSKANIGTPHTELYKHFVTFFFCLNNLTYTFLSKPYLSFIIMFLSLPADNSHIFCSFELVLCTAQTISLQLPKQSDSSRWILDCQYSTRKRRQQHSVSEFWTQTSDFWILKFAFTTAISFDLTCHLHHIANLGYFVYYNN